MEIGISLLLETDLFRIKEVNQILDSVLEENVGILVDVGHCWHRAREEPSEVIREAANRLFLLHINDNNGKEDDHLIPGEGAINWGNILKALEKVSYKGIFMMECFNSRITKDNNAIARLAKKASEKLLGRQIISD
jgi:sugar phosphate isomerase/epimerase